MGPGSKVLTYRDEQAVYPRGSEELGLESAFLSLGQPKTLYQEKRVLSWLSTGQSSGWKETWEHGRQRLEGPFLHLSLEKSRSPRIIKRYSSSP